MSEVFLQRLGETWRNIEELNSLIRAIQLKIEQKNSQFNPNDISRMRSEITERYDESISAVTELQRIVSSLLTAPQIERPLDAGDDIPTKEMVQQWMSDFFKSELKKRSPPIPATCGCYSHKIVEPHYGDFVCARYKDSFILMIVLKCDKQTGVCSVFDPTDIENGVNVVDLPREDWIALATMIPDVPKRRWEYPGYAEVLSLWPNGDDWTTEFYKATVKRLPCERMDKTLRGYELNFEGEVRVVPEKFVVTFKDSWKSG